MLNKFNEVIKDLWWKSGSHKSLTLFERCFWASLCFFEFFYKIGFCLVQSIKKYYGQRTIPGLKIISVGNLTVGGTGKTVFIQFLAKFLDVKRCAVVSRGYGSRSAGKNLLVSDGQNIYYKPEHCGDEPFMIAQSIKVVTATGSNRVNSCLKVRELSDKIEYILLDDAYQNHQLIKDLQILLVDARFPLGFNGHCLPAGNLRELDYSRADLIVVSHANLVNDEQINKIKKQIFNTITPDKILLGKHSAVGLFQAGSVMISHENFANKKFMIAAGIGSFSGFMQSVNDFGISVEESLEFDDHHNYSSEDVDKIIQKLTQKNLSGVVVTQKDWVKLSQIISDETAQKFFVFRIEFEFLSEAQYILFGHFLSSKLGYRYER